MTKENQDIEMREGDDVAIRSTITDEADGTIRDVTGDEVDFWLIDNSGEVVLSYTNADSNTGVLDGPNGIVEVILDSADTEGLGHPTRGAIDYTYEIEVTDTDGSVYTVTTGELKVWASE